MAMAAKLHLPERQLDALERDDYQQLPPPAFVRGYLRAYARELEIDSDDIVAAYDALGPDAEDPALRPVEGNRAPGGPLATAASLAVLALVVAAAFAGWWWQQRDAGDAAPAAGEPAAESPAESGEGSDAADGPTETASNAAGEAEGETGDAMGNADAAAETTASETATASADTGQETDAEAGGSTASAGSGQGAGEGDATASPQAEAAATEEAPADQNQDEAGGDDEPTSDYEPPAATSSAEAAVAPPASEGPDTLVVEVAGRSWIEIRDARDRRLVYTLYSGDAPLRLRGWAPFDVFLGNSPAVRLRFGGEFVPKGGFTRSNNTARFLVDAEGARRR